MDGFGNVRTASGLSDQQLAELFEVPAATVELWRRGGQMADHHARLLTSLRAAVEGCAADTPEGRARELLKSGPGGRSVFQRLCAGDTALPVQ